MDKSLFATRVVQSMIDYGYLLANKEAEKAKERGNQPQQKKKINKKNQTNNNKTTRRNIETKVVWEFWRKKFVFKKTVIVFS